MAEKIANKVIDRAFESIMPRSVNEPSPTSSKKINWMQIQASMDHDKSKYCLCCPGFEETFFYFLPIYHRNNEIPSQNMVGREGFEPSNPAMSRRYLNQARPPALALRQHKNFVPLTVNAISF